MSEIREMQLCIIEMIKEVDSLFTQNNIQYTLLGGSVLGSIRHKGFIPWDDDMDIGIMRKNFEKAEVLLSSMEKYTYERAEKHIIPDAPTGHLHLINEKYPIENSPTIDVFALDGVPKSKIGRKLFRFFANIHHVSVLRTYPKTRGKFAKYAIKLIIIFVPNKLWDLIQKFSLNLLMKISARYTEYTGNVWGYWTEKEYFKTPIYTHLIKSEFEGIQLPIPSSYDEYLTQLYNNYMELPPVEKRVPKHRTF